MGGTPKKHPDRRRPSIEFREDREKIEGYTKLEKYFSFAERVRETKRHLLETLITYEAQWEESIVGYGAPGKGNTLLNYCGIRSDFLDYIVDRNPYKQGSSCQELTFLFSILIRLGNKT